MVQTIKTAVVVVLLLFVLYGGYVALNGTETPLKEEIENMVGTDTLPDVSGPNGPRLSSNSINASTGFEAFNSSPAPTFGSSNSPSPFGQSTASSFPPAKEFETSLPFNNSSPASNASPFLIPSTLPSPPSSLPPSANNSAFPSLPPLPGGKSSSIKSSSTEPVPVSTNTPTFGMNVPSTKIPADLASNTTTGPTSTSPLSTLPLLASNNQDRTDPPSSSNDKTGSPIKPPSASKSYENARELAMEQVERGKLKEGLATLSVFYNAPELTTEQRHDLLDLLDSLAREVVFSRRHFLDSVYVVAPGETLAEISKRYDIPQEILARINAIDTKTQLPSGAPLKVVPGPFRAEVDMTRNELTVFLGDLYAGRYPVSFGNDPMPKPGIFQVIEKQQNKNYYGNGVQIPASDPRNPYGGYWIDLGQDVCIHGSTDTPSDGKLGCISLSPYDASDVFGMLSRGSPVTVKR